MLLIYFLLLRLTLRYVLYTTWKTFIFVHNSIDDVHSKPRLYYNSMSYTQNCIINYSDRDYELTLQRKFITIIFFFLNYKCVYQTGFSNEYNLNSETCSFLWCVYPIGLLQAIQHQNCERKSCLINF